MNLLSIFVKDVVREEKTQIDLKQKVWNMVKPVPGYDSTQFRKDAYGAWICYSEFDNRFSKFGWEIDEIIPSGRNERQSISNLQPLQWQNKRNKFMPAAAEVVVANGMLNM